MILTKSNISDYTEIELIEKSKKDKRFFEPLYKKYYEQVFRLVFSRVQDVDLAGDITSEAFGKALSHLDDYEYKGYPLSAWLARIALNSCYDYFRSQKKQRHVSLENYVSHDMVFEIEIGENEKELWLTMLPEVLEKLKPAELELIELRFFEGKSFAEIGYILDITEGNAKTRTYRILKRLKRHFKRSTS